jgi:type I restriction enzyme M protein
VVEAIIALPTEIFFRTGIGTYIWLLSNKKPAHRKGRVQLIDATALYEPMRKSEGNKRRRVGDDQIRQIVQMYSDFAETKESQIFDARDFGYRRVKVLRPLRKKVVISPEGLAALADETASGKLSPAEKTAWTALFQADMGEAHGWHRFEAWVKNAAKCDPGLGRVNAAVIKAFQKVFGVRDPDLDPVLDKNGVVIPDDDLTDFENIPLGTDIRDYMAQEVLPHAHDAYVDEDFRDEYDGQVRVVAVDFHPELTRVGV